MYRISLFLLASSCGSEICFDIDTPNGRATVCPGSRVEVHSGGDDGVPLYVRRMYVCEPADQSWSDGPIKVKVKNQPVFYDVETFWAITCGADVSLGDETVAADESVLLDAGGAIACESAGVEMVLDPDASAARYSFLGRDGDHQSGCDCHGDC